MKGDLTCIYLNQTEDQCNTQKGLELFRQVINRYEEYTKGDYNEEDDEDDEFTSSSITKRQKLDSSNSLIIETGNNKSHR